MKRNATLSLVAALAVFLAAPLSVGAQTHITVSDDGPTHYNGSLGFHSIDAPLGGRYWFANQKIGVDVGFGLRSDPAPAYDEHLTGWDLELGVPFLLKSWDRVHLLARPGFLYDNQEVVMSDPPEPFATDSRTTVALSAELEAEVFIVNNFSVSASHGIRYVRTDPAGGGDSDSSWSTTGADFSHIGFHYYFFGGGS
jgi:hypothetical protein